MAYDPDQILKSFQDALACGDHVGAAQSATLGLKLARQGVLPKNLLGLAGMRAWLRKRAA